MQSPQPARDAGAHRGFLRRGASEQPVVPAENDTADHGVSLLGRQLVKGLAERLVQSLGIEAPDQIVDRLLVVRDRRDAEAAPRAPVHGVAPLPVAEQVSRHRPQPWPGGAVGRNPEPVAALEQAGERLLRQVEGELASPLAAASAATSRAT